MLSPGRDVSEEVSAGTANPLEVAGSPPTSRVAWLRVAPGCVPRVVLIVTGSVASVKVPEIVVSLSEFAEVAVVFTGHSRTMVGRRIAGNYAPAWFKKFERLRAEGSVRTMDDRDEWHGYRDVSADAVIHIELRRWADVAVVAPCSAHTLAKVALGLSDNLATCLLRAWDPSKPLIVVPAMNTLMWQHPTNTQHLQILESWGYRIVPPMSKLLACGDFGRGALAPVGEVVEAVRSAVEGFEGRRAGNGTGNWHCRGFPEWRSSL